MVSSEGSCAAHFRYRAIDTPGPDGVADSATGAADSATGSAADTATDGGTDNA